MAYGPAQASAAPWMNPAWLAASADRERAVGVLRAGFAEGRLSQDELDDRVTRAYTARTYGELWALTADLPAGPFAPSYGPVAVTPGNAAQVTNWRPAAALIITALIIFTLAALITAIVTTHTSGVPVQFQQVQVAPGPQQALPLPAPALPPGAQQGVILTPFIVHVPGELHGQRAIVGSHHGP